MKCGKCGKELTGKQTSYCSPRCSKLHLKSLYKKRNREKVNAYNREYRKRNKRGKKARYFVPSGNCYFCGRTKKIHQHHLNYEINLVVDLCRSCHHKYHVLIRKQKSKYE